MSIQNIMKNSNIDVENLTANSFSEIFSKKKKQDVILIRNLCVLFFSIAVVSGSALLLKNMNLVNPDGNLISTLPTPMAATTSKKDVITIPAGVVKANPFVPYRPLKSEIANALVNDVPKFDLIAPPGDTSSNLDASRIMETIVSGILYDKFSPSAILKIDGSDYLVKKGDVVNNYKVLAIDSNSVTVKLGNNTYKAGIGEILTEGNVNYNDVSNLSKKFGGEKR